MKVVLSLCFVILLAGCAPTLTPVPSPVGESPTPAATWTPVPPTATATVTPMPKLTMEDLKSMSGADKLKMAPQAESAPKDVVSSFAAGENAKDIAWSGKSLTFWERVVAYEGTTRSGEKVTLYYDLESGQWAKQYADFDEVSKIPADEVADVMVVNDENGAHLVRNKLQYDYDWISQPQVMIEGKMVFRDEKGYPKAIWDTNAKKWLRPEETDIPWTREKWEKASIGAIYNSPLDGKEYQIPSTFKDPRYIVLGEADINKIEEGTEILILHSSGEMQIWANLEDAKKAFKDGATIVIPSPNYGSRNGLTFGIDSLLATAFSRWQSGDKDVFIRFGEFQSTHMNSMAIYVNEIPYFIDKNGRRICPILEKPKFFKVYGNDISGPADKMGVTDLIYWFDQFTAKGFNAMTVFINEQAFDFANPP